MGYGQHYGYVYSIGVFLLVAAGKIKLNIFIIFCTYSVARGSR